MAEAEPTHRFFPKDPAEQLDYTWDFTNLLASGEEIATIDSVDVDPSSGTPVAVVASSIQPGGKEVTVVLNAGEACIEYTITVNVTTDRVPNANSISRSCILPVEDR